MLLSNYDLTKNHGEFVHLNMLKDTLLKVGKIDTSTIASDVFEIDKVCVTKDKAIISYTTTSGQKKTYTVNFFNEYVKENENTNRLVSQYFTYQNNEITKITLNYEDGQTKEINVPEKINDYISRYFDEHINNYIGDYLGRHITYQAAPVTDIAFQEDEIVVRTESGSNTYDLARTYVPDIKTFTMGFRGILYFTTGGATLKMGLSMSSNFLIVGGKGFSSNTQAVKTLESPFDENVFNTVSIDDDLFNNSSSRATHLLRASIGKINENDQLTLDTTVNDNGLYLLPDKINFLQPSVSAHLINLTMSDREESVYTNLSTLTSVTGQSTHTLFKLGDTGHFMDAYLSITPSGQNEGKIYFNARFGKKIYLH